MPGIDSFGFSSRLEQHARVRPGAEAVGDASRTLTYGQLYRTVCDLAAELQRGGLREGNSVAILMTNRVEWLLYMFAAWAAGGVVVPVSYFSTSAELEVVVSDVGASWIVTEPDLAHLTEPTVPGRQVLLASIPPENAEAAQIGSQPPHVRRYEDVALIQYTSGTVGHPKAIQHSHASILWNAMQQLPDLDIDSTTTTLVVPSLAWGAGLHDLTLGTLWVGGRVVLFPSRALAADRLLSMIAAEHVSHTFLSPSVLRRLVSAPAAETRHDLSSLRVVLTGGEPLEAALLERVHDRFGRMPLRPSYGLSEFPSTMTLMPPDEVWTRPSSVGRATGLVDIRVVDDGGARLPAGQPGELICRSPAVMIGYRDGAGEGTAALRDGWLYTGDIATIDDDGFVTIVGRKKDMLISGGLNVYCSEVEQALLAHDAVREAAVVGVPDSQWGQVPCAHLVLEKGRDLSALQLDEFLGRRLASYKRPKRYLVHQGRLPRNSAGKVLKPVLLTMTDGVATVLPCEASQPPK